MIRIDFIAEVRNHIQFQSQSEHFLGLANTGCINFQLAHAQIMSRGHSNARPILAILA